VTTVPTPRALIPVPPGRGRWRLTLHNRQFADTSWQNTLIAELTDARGRQLVQQLNSSASLTFSLDGQSDGARLIHELDHDVIAWRWNELTGADVPYFRGIIAQSEDQLSEQAHTVTFTAHDYLAVLTRRFVTATLNYNNVDQDSIVADLLARSSAIVTTDGATSFVPGSYLPLHASNVAQDGTARGLSGQLRVRTYAGSSEMAQTIDDLAHVINGYDYDVVPGWRYGGTNMADLFRIFYPNQGVVRSAPVLEYGGAIAALTRSLNSGDYADFERVLGNNGSADPAAAQRYSEQWNSDANNITVSPVGLWMNSTNAADVSVQATLDQQALGSLNYDGLLMPSYTLTLAPNVYRDGLVNMGDTVPVVIRSGRLNVNTALRIVGLTFDIGDDGQEDVGVTVGRPLTSLLNMLDATSTDVNALARR
jgi:hypothetical protein